MRPQLQAAVKDLKDKSKKSLELVKERVVDTSKETAHKINVEAHRKPWHFVGAFAFLSGIFGYFLGRKGEKKK